MPITRPTEGRNKIAPAAVILLSAVLCFFLGACQGAAAKPDTAAASSEFSGAAEPTPASSPSRPKTAWDDPEVQKAAREAQRLFNRGQAAAAIETMNRAVATAPEDAELLEVLGGMYFRDKQWEKSAAALAKAVALAPDVPQSRLLYSRALLHLYKPEEALEQVKKAAELDPYSAMYQVNLGSVYETLKDRAAARRAYEKAVEIDPGYAEGWYSLGELDAEEKNSAAAVRNYKKALESESESSLSEEVKNELRQKIKNLEKTTPNM